MDSIDKDSTTDEIINKISSMGRQITDMIKSTPVPKSDTLGDLMRNVALSSDKYAR